MNASRRPGSGERMNIRREAPGVSKAMAELEREITLEPVVRELVKLRASILPAAPIASTCTARSPERPASPNSAYTQSRHGETHRSSASVSAPHSR